MANTHLFFPPETDQATCPSQPRPQRRETRFAERKKGRDHMITVSIRGWEQDQGDVEIVLKRPELRRSDSAWTSTRFTLSVAVTAASAWPFHTLSVITFQQSDHLSWKWCQDGGCWLWLSQTESHRKHLRSEWRRDVNRSGQ